ncbi:MAG: ATP-binding protein [Candidatus Thermoplasmatota archaeon]|jgi:predicted ATP-dependent endonuclease of OLD family|nr:ATP-binding protein [Candidatus Thermoplasmatota archaeon]
MKIDEVSIENFKGIDSLRFEPRLLNVIVGRNNTGKTSILEALAIAMDPDFIKRNYPEFPSSIINYLVNTSRISVSFSNKTKHTNDVLIEKVDAQVIVDKMANSVLENIKSFQAELGKPSSSSRYLSNRFVLLSDLARDDIAKFQESIQTVLADQLTPEIVKRLSQECVAIKVGNEENLFFGEEFRSYQERLTLAVFENLYKKRYGAEKDILRRLVLGLRYRSAPILATDKTNERKRGPEIVYVKEPMQYLKRTLGKEQGIQELALKIEEILKKDKIVPNLIRFDFTEVVFETVQGRKSVKFNRMGEGFQTLVAVLSILRSIENPQTIFLIEEPEVHMHPGYVSELVKYLAQISASLNVQLFITTHSYDLIQSLIEGDYSSDLKEYLRENLLLLRLTKTDDLVIGESLFYEEAQSNISNLQLDLRGI